MLASNIKPLQESKFILHRQSHKTPGTNPATSHMK